MTNEERFSNNINIAYKIASKYLVNHANEYEDIKQVALMGLWKAVLTYNKSNAFSTYAYAVVHNEINYYLRKIRKNSNTISLKQEIKNGITFEDMLTNSNNEFESIENRLDVERYIQKIKNSELRENQKIVFELSLRGYKQDKIARTIGISQAQVSRIIKGLRKKIS